MLDSFLSAGVVYLLYAMGGFPFAIWAGRAACAATLANAAQGKPARPGRAMTVFFVLLPLLFIALTSWNSGDVPPGAGSADFDPLADDPDDWSQVMFLLLPPCVGLIAGCGLGWLLGHDRARRR